MVHRRSQNESWVAHLYRAGSYIEFSSIGVQLSLELLYEHVTFQQRTRKAHRRKVEEQ
ncbi:MAG TPA: hypothetical protein VFA10_05440 [Ktedonobacteraceae bacterium]|nr:hypothetical protein [Ktedonobacteraceae bacterium]